MGGSTAGGVLHIFYKPEGNGEKADGDSSELMDGCEGKKIRWAKNCVICSFVRLCLIFN